MLRITYRLPSVDNMKQITDLMRLTFSFIDSFAAVQLTKSVCLFVITIIRVIN